MDGDFDVRQRSLNGCIPPLLSMSRLERCTIEEDHSVAEQEVRLYSLLTLDTRHIAKSHMLEGRYLNNILTFVG